MLEQLSWEFFTHTGSVEAFLEYTKIKELNSIDKGNSNLGNDN